MKELIGLAVFLVSLWGVGSYTLRTVHDTVKKAALGKVARGLPSLTKMTKSLRGESVKEKKPNAR